ncbi:hypothetical protein LX36DRAFT_208242 [Colletotrichum falcatum]|nr:hypothetical protein LX36DRAFT_208242 [Colletotrichum falcatum]
MRDQIGAASKQPHVCRDARGCAVACLARASMLLPTILPKEAKERCDGVELGWKKQHRSSLGRSFADTPRMPMQCPCPRSPLFKHYKHVSRTASQVSICSDGVLRRAQCVKLFQSSTDNRTNPRHGPQGCIRHVGRVQRGVLGLLSISACVPTFVIVTVLNSTALGTRHRTADVTSGIGSQDGRQPQPSFHPHPHQKGGPRASARSMCDRLRIHLPFNLLVPVCLA